MLILLDDSNYGVFDAISDTRIPVAKMRGMPYMAQGHVYPPASPTTTNEPTPQASPTRTLAQAPAAFARGQWNPASSAKASAATGMFARISRLRMSSTRNTAP